MQFEKIVGQQSIKERLVSSIDQGRVSHAQLFSGKSGYGTLALAIAYVQYLNCRDRRDGESCGVCGSCHKIEQLQHPDLHFIFPIAQRRAGTKQSITDTFLPQWREMVQQTDGYFTQQQWNGLTGRENQLGMISRHDASEVIKKLSLKPFEDGYKAMIIWQPETMMEQGANAILKILEEPWEKTLFILVSESPNELLPTILSRTQQLVVPGIENQPMKEYLDQRYPNQEQEVEQVVKLAQGDMVEAKRLMEGETNNEQKEYFKLFADLMRHSFANKHIELIKWAENVVELGREKQIQLLQYSIAMLRESYMINAGMESITYLMGEEMAFCRKFSPFITNHNIEILVKEMETTIRQIGQSGNPRIIFPHFALTVSTYIVKP